MGIDVYGDLVSKCIDGQHGKIDGNKRYAVVCQVVFVWEKECSVVVFIMFLSKTRNNWLTGRVLNTLHSRIVCAQIRAKEWYVCIYVCVCVYSRNWLGCESLAPHCRILYTKSLSHRLYEKHIHIHIREQTRMHWMLAANRQSQIANKL